MAGAFSEGENEFVLSVKNALFGTTLNYSCQSHPFNRSGNVSGFLVGGNLSIMAHLTGTPSMPSLKGAILFLEDVGEYLYNIDRMLLQLDRAGKFKDLAALIIGGFTDYKDTITPIGKTAYELIADRISGYKFPVVFDFPVSHDKNNVALGFGMEYLLKVVPEMIKLIGKPGLKQLHPVAGSIYIHSCAYRSKHNYIALGNAMTFNLSFFYIVE